VGAIPGKLNLIVWSAIEHYLFSEQRAGKRPCLLASHAKRSDNYNYLRPELTTRTATATTRSFHPTGETRTTDRSGLSHIASARAQIAKMVNS